tara:strand:+ start:12283 stop:14109 length:1827 start_codon:yes stop_codon:yes gene_type:complete
MAKADNPFSDIPTPGLREGLGYGWRAMALVWRTAPRLTLAIATATILLAVAPALAAYVAKLIIDAILAALDSNAQADRMAALGWTAVEAAVLGGMLAARRLLTFLKRLLHAQLGYAVSRLIFAKTLRLDLQTIEKADVQQQILLARQHAAARPYGLITRIFEGGQYALTIVTFAAVLWTFSPWAVLIVLLGGLPLFASELNFSAHVFRFYTGRTPEMRERNYLEGLMTSETAAVERLHAGSTPALVERHSKLFDWLFGEDRKLQSRRTAVGVALIAVSSAIFMGGKLWVVWATVLGAITLGQMTMYAALLKQGQNTMTSLLATISGGYEDLLYVSNLYALLALDEGVLRGTKREGPMPGDGYRLTDITLTYPNTNRPALNGVSLHIPHGQKLGIVGANGSGKTTLVKILLGLYQPDSGAITLDGLDLCQWAPDALFARTATLFQPFQRYNFTVGENIAMGEGLRVTDAERLLQAAADGLAMPLIEDLPDGLDTKLSKQFLDGRELSGGQWQRLALSRAMLRTGADTLILDEPTAALDPEAEASVLEATGQAGHTVVLISHRLSNLRHADHIILLDKGRIVESGTHDALMEQNGRYRAMFDKQAELYRE